MISWILLALTMCGLPLTYLLRFHISKEGIKFYEFLACITFSLFFFTLHYKIINERCFFFHWCLPSLRADHPAISWIAFLFMVLHSFTSPVGWKLKKWYSPW